jgi:hypothetical protein
MPTIRSTIALPQLCVEAAYHEQVAHRYETLAADLDVDEAFRLLAGALRRLAAQHRERSQRPFHHMREDIRRRVPMSLETERVSTAIEVLVRQHANHSDTLRELQHRFPRASMTDIRHAALYAVTDPELRDPDLTARIYDFALAMRMQE